MDQLFASLAISGASLVSKAAFSYAQGYAVKQLTTFVAKTTADKGAVHKKLDALQRTLALKLAVITPSIDTCEILAARGNTSLEPVLELAEDLRRSLRVVSDRVTDADPACLDGGADVAGRNALTVEVLEDVTRVLAAIDNLVPFLNLALQNSGTSIGDGGAAAVVGGVSPSRLLQASTAVALADGRFYSHTQFGPNRPPQPVKVGQDFPVRVYSLFQSSARAKGLSDVTWKEDHAKANVCVQRCHGSESVKIAYDLVITPDRDDGRFHDEKEEGIVSATRISISDLRKVFYSRSGSLLNHSDARGAPVLVLKVEKDSAPLPSSGSETPRAKSAAATEWLAFELWLDDDEGRYDDSTSDESDSDVEGTGSSPTSARPVTPTEPPSQALSTHRQPAPAQHKPSLGMLSTLELILRLTAMEISEQRSHLETTDEKLMLYLTNELRGSNRSGQSSGIASQAQLGPPSGTVSSGVRRRSGGGGVVDSPLARKAGFSDSPLFDRLKREADGLATPQTK
ncbi:hypothetical protein HDU88_005466 [Geranomyces variabilis]|nr:hypothetical protein HDU88_005466 [Geranomyces variabilis]